MIRERLGWFYGFSLVASRQMDIASGSPYDFDGPRFAPPGPSRFHAVAPDPAISNRSRRNTK